MKPSGQRLTFPTHSWGRSPSRRGTVWILVESSRRTVGSTVAELAPTASRMKYIVCVNNDKYNNVLVFVLLLVIQVTHKGPIGLLNTWKGRRSLGCPSHPRQLLSLKISRPFSETPTYAHAKIMFLIHFVFYIISLKSQSIPNKKNVRNPLSLVWQRPLV